MGRKLLFIIIAINFTYFLYANGSSEGNLDRAIDAQGNFLVSNIPPNSIMAIIGISSGNEELSRYITEGITSYIINNNRPNIKIVEREAMPILKEEINFQYSGAVDDNFMVSLGNMVGANIVVAGTIYSIGKELRFNVRAIELETSIVITSNGIDLKADKKIKSLLNGGTVEKTLNRDNIPIRQNDGSISKANQELRENQKRTAKNTANFFTMDFVDREPRWLIGYNYFPDFPLSIEFGYFRNGMGFYTGIGSEPKNWENNYEFSYIEESIGVFNWFFGITYPLFFDWLWISAGGEMCVVNTTNEQVNYSGTNYLSEQEMVFNPSIGLYLWFKRFYFTGKYRYILYGEPKSSFMIGAGIGLK
ncbi:MAG: penicillin-binding protein activator LpoB [Treponema sp.]|jgi:TolB-like protein|nr:penicillin-binding protein activator LpoB [Treponema sp.]